MSRAIRTGRFATLVGVAACVLAVPSGAFASNHEIKIREVYAGSLAVPDSEYVELQMYAPGQNLFNGGTTTTLYNATGAATTSFVTNGSTANPPNAANQDRVLIASPAAVAEFGLGTVGYQFAAGDHLSPTGGAACYESSTASFKDCVAWGNFSGSLPSSTGGNVDGGGVPDGKALGRSISRGCPTMLEAGDDTNAPGDWSNVTPNPLKNSDTPPEKPCPNTTITKKPKAKTTDRTPTFKFKSSLNPATFECKLDDAKFKSCQFPLTTKKLSLGKHKFKVRAIANGVKDPTPARASFKVVNRH
jgi:hypothetical protein